MMHWRHATRYGLATLSCAIASASVSQARSASAADAREKRWGVGIEVTGLSQPRGHLGLGGNAGYALTPMLVARYQLASFAALDAGFGLPHPSLGAGGWLAGEVFAPIVSNARKTLALSLFQQTGLQLGYTGPDYYARHGNYFVGYQYAVAGPMTFAFRLPAGICLRWAGGYLDSYVEAVPIIALTPATEMLYDMSFGTRFRF